MTDAQTTTMYVVIGSLIVGNLSTIVTVLISVMKLSAKFGRMEHQIEANQKDINNAWQEIRHIKSEGRVKNGKLSGMD